MSKGRGLFVGLLLLIIAGVYILFFYENVKEPTIPQGFLQQDQYMVDTTSSTIPTGFTPHDRELYALQPERIYPLYSDYFEDPYVSMSPDSPLYRFSLFKERVDRMVYGYDDLFFASKRVFEFVRWPGDFGGFSDEYSKLMNGYISSLSTLSYLSRDAEYAKVYTYMEHHRRLLSSQVPAPELNRLYDPLIDSIYPHRNDNYPMLLRISLKQLLNDQAVGQYRMKVEYPRFHLTNLQYSINQPINLSGSVERLDRRVDSFETVRIDETTSYIFIHSSTILDDLVDQNPLEWRERYVTTSERPYRYYVDLNPHNHYMTYFFKGVNRSDIEINLSIQEVDTASSRLVSVRNRIIPQGVSQESVYYYRHAYSSPKTFTRIELATKTPLDNYSQALSFSMPGFYEPTVTLERISALPDRPLTYSYQSAGRMRYSVTVVNGSEQTINNVKELLRKEWQITAETKSGSTVRMDIVEKWYSFLQSIVAYGVLLYFLVVGLQLGLINRAMTRVRSIMVYTFISRQHQWIIRVCIGLGTVTRWTNPLLVMVILATLAKQLFMGLYQDKLFIAACLSALLLCLSSKIKSVYLFLSAIVLYLLSVGFWFLSLRQIAFILVSYVILVWMMILLQSLLNRSS